MTFPISLCYNLVFNSWRIINAQEWRFYAVSWASSSLLNVVSGLSSEKKFLTEFF